MHYVGLRGQLLCGTRVRAAIARLRSIAAMSAARVYYIDRATQVGTDRDW